MGARKLKYEEEEFWDPGVIDAKFIEELELEWVKVVYFQAAWEDLDLSERFHKIPAYANFERRSFTERYNDAMNKIQKLRK